MRVAIVGGGVVGLSVALRLRDEGVETLVLERSIPGAEASSAAAGMLAPQVEAARPGPFLDLCLRSRALYPAFAEELRERSGMDVGFVPCGTLWVAFDEATRSRQRATAEWQRAHGLRAELLDTEQARSIEQALSPAIQGALLLPDDHQVDNRRLVRALSQAAARAGVDFRTGYVRGLLRVQERVTGVDLDGAPLEADAVVVAAGSWTGLVSGLPLSPRSIRPAKGQMVQLQMRAPPLTRVVCGPNGYVVPRVDGRVICGSTVEFRGFDKQVTAQGLSHVLAAAQEICPALAEAAVTEFWAGLRPYTEDHLPILGPGPLAGLFLASGHFRNGILLAPITAKLIADAVLGRRCEIDLSPFEADRRTLA